MTPAARIWFLSFLVWSIWLFCAGQFIQISTPHPCLPCSSPCFNSSIYPAIHKSTCASSKLSRRELRRPSRWIESGREEERESFDRQLSHYSSGSQPPCPLLIFYVWKEKWLKTPIIIQTGSFKSINIFSHHANMRALSLPHTHIENPYIEKGLTIK